MAMIPATLPAKALLKLAVGIFIVLTSTVVIAPTTLALRCTPAPTTVTSSKASEVTFMTISIFSRPETATSCLS